MSPSFWVMYSFVLIFVFDILANELFRSNFSDIFNGLPHPEKRLIDGLAQSNQ